MRQRHWRRHPSSQNEALSGNGRAERNFRHNAAHWNPAAPCAMHGQGEPPLCLMRYGRHPFFWNGCGVIAVYNVLLWCGRYRPLPELIWEFERNRMCWILPTGLFGTHPGKLGRPLAAMGLACRTTKRREEFLAHAAEGEFRCGIISYWNHRISAHPLNFFGGGMHTVAWRYRDGQYELYNVHAGDSEPQRAADLSAFLEDRRMVRAYWL